MTKTIKLLPVILVFISNICCKRSNQKENNDDLTFLNTFPVYYIDENDTSPPPMCPLHVDTQILARYVKVFHGQMPVDEEYIKARGLLFPYWDDPIPENHINILKAQVYIYICPKCCEARDAWLLKNR